MAIYGYIRVSKKEQNEGRQIDALEKYAKDRGIVYDAIFIDKYTRKTFNRPEYNTLKKILRSGDEIVVKEMDRFGGNYEEMKKELTELENMDIEINILDFPILIEIEDKTLKKLVRGMIRDVLSYVAEKERDKIQQRVVEGLARAKKEGKKLGRPPVKLPKNFDRYYRNYKNGLITVIDLAKLIGKSRTTTYRYIEIYEKLNKKDFQIDIYGEAHIIEE